MTRTRELPPAPAPAGKDRADHVNEVILVGALAAPPEPRTLPSGDEVLSFRLSVRSSASPAHTARSPDRAPARTDSVDCVAVRPAVRNRLLRCSPGDVLRVEGALRHRYWRGAGGINSRYEVEVEATALLRRHPSPPASSAPPA